MAYRQHTDREQLAKAAQQQFELMQTSPVKDFYGHTTALLRLVIDEAGGDYSILDKDKQKDSKAMYVAFHTALENTCKRHMQQQYDTLKSTSEDVHGAQQHIQACMDYGGLDYTDLQRGEPLLSSDKMKAKYEQDLAIAYKREATNWLRLLRESKHAITASDAGEKLMAMIDVGHITAKKVVGRSTKTEQEVRCELAHMAEIAATYADTGNSFQGVLAHAKRQL